MPLYATWPYTIDAPSETVTTLRGHSRESLTSDILQSRMAPGLRCFSTISWNCDSFSSHDPRYKQCWQAAISAQSDTGVNGVDPCANTDGWFELGGPRTVSLDTADPSHRWSTFIASLTSTLDATADSSVTLVDYISATPQADLPLDTVHVAETSTITISRQALTEGANMDSWLGQRCDASTGGGTLFVDPSRMEEVYTTATSCLLTPSQQHLDTQHYVLPTSAPVVTITDGDVVQTLNVCDDMGFSSDPTGVYCYYTVADESSNQCTITSVDAPPGTYMLICG